MGNGLEGQLMNTMDGLPLTLTVSRRGQLLVENLSKL